MEGLLLLSLIDWRFLLRLVRLVVSQQLFLL
jgi:hypothetical protein